jgi:hypothetical protein
MIPKSTPAGTEVVFIERNPEPTHVARLLPTPAFGELCVVEQILPSSLVDTKFAAGIVGYEAWFCLSCFRLLEKPRELYSLLERAPVKETV